MSRAEWYAIRVKSNRERVTADALRGRDCEVCLPSYSVQRTSRNRARVVELPLFPGYIFCRFDAGNRMPIMTAPGVVHIVGLGNVPQPVDPNEMLSVFRLLEGTLPAVPHPYATGYLVRIHSGPLKGVEGVVIAHKDATKLVVSVTLLQRSIAVDVEPGWVQGATSHQIEARGYEPEAMAAPEFVRARA